MANFLVRFVTFAFLAFNFGSGSTAIAQGTGGQDELPWQQPVQNQDPYAPGSRNYDPNSADNASQYQPREYTPPASTYRPPAQAYRPPAPQTQHNANTQDQSQTTYSQSDSAGNDDGQYYSESEIVEAGHHFFGKLSEGLAKAIETVFRRQGRPTAYILGQDAGGAFVAGLRYGEGYLHTKSGDRRKVFWQGPSLGYDFGGEGSRTMVLVYNLRHPDQIYRRFGGVQGSAYVIGGASVQLLKRDNITLAPIRTGVGLRLGGNIGYLKYTRRPTWNPF